MEEQKIKTEVIEYLNEYIRKNRIETDIDLNTVSPDLDLGHKLGIDSLDGLEILFDFEERFNIQINDADSRLISRHLSLSNITNAIIKLK